MKSLIAAVVLSTALIARAAPADDLAKTITTLIQGSGLESNHLAIAVQCLDTDRRLFEHRADTSLRTASNHKLFVTAAALCRLGTDWRFRTVLYADGKIEGQRLKGDLIVVGSGDPNISGRFYNGDRTAVFKTWAARVKAAGIGIVEGDVIADDTLFDRQYVHPDWDPKQLGQWYCAEVCALSFNDNCIDLRVTAGAVIDDPAQYWLHPNTRFVRIVNQCKTSKSLHAVRLERPAFRNDIYLRGSFRAGDGSYDTSVTVHNPAAYFATVLGEALTAAGIRIAGRARVAEEPTTPFARGCRILAATDSTMLQSVQVANKRSQNLYAELILRTLGRELEGEGSFEAGGRAVRQFLVDAKLDIRSFAIADGSGLSRQNKGSAGLVAALLRHMYRGHDAAAFRSSLSVAGIDGSLRNRLQSAATRGKVLAKTGYIADTCCLSGYAETAGGHTVAFSILANDYRTSTQHVRDFQDDLVRELVRLPPCD